MIFYIFGVILGGVISVTFFCLRPRFLNISQAMLNFSDYRSYWGAIKSGIIHIFWTFYVFYALIIDFRVRIVVKKTPKNSSLLSRPMNIFGILSMLVQSVYILHCLKQIINYKIGIYQYKFLYCDPINID